MPEYKKVNDIAPKLNKIESDINNITQEIEDLIKLKVKLNYNICNIYISSLFIIFLCKENYEQKELNSETTNVEPEEDTKKECEEEDPMKHLTPVQRIYASNRVNFIII